jgi:DNA helicase II / ATP-dependent DNA helicase PcrA
MMDLSFLQQLNDVQQQAVMDVEGPQLIVAGAGSGKTRVLTYRLAFLLSQGLADQQELLALTFTNKAAKEMKSRIESLIGSVAKSINMGTFHSVFAKILRADADRIGYTRSFTIYDDDDCISLINNIIKELKFDDKVIKSRNVLNYISHCKNEVLTAAKAKDFITDDFQTKANAVYQIYENRCLKANAMDFSDLLMKPIELFRNSPDILHKYQHRFKYIMVDEYQDTNGAQYTLTKMLAAVHENICVVGDDAQSIYAFRGANIKNILNLKKDYPGLKIYKLEQNYRSTSNIVEAANSLIKHNKDQIQKNVFTDNEAGDLIQLVEADSEQDEAKRVCDLIRGLRQTKSMAFKDFAILYRTNAQSRAIEDSLRRAGLKYKIFGGLSFYKRKEVKDIVAYLRIAINPADEQAMVRIINYPTRGISDASVNTLLGFAAQNKMSFWDAVQQSQNTGLNPRAVGSIQKFILLVENFKKIASTKSAADAVKEIAEASGVLKELHTEGTTEALARWENVQELINSAKEYSETTNAEADRLEAYLAEISLFTDMDEKEEDTDYVSLMTIHSSKGLEFKSIFLVGVEQGLFPSAMMMQSRKDLEEERRLFYVALTRAEKYLYITFAKSRLRYGQLQYNEPSQFLFELDKNYITFTRSSKSASTISFKTTPSDVSAPRRVSIPNATPIPENFIATPSDELKVGQTVIHPKFGEGKITNIEGVSDQKKAHVTFKESGERVLLLKYAKLMVIEK